MSKMKKTKMGLLMSVISIVLCCSMLVGTTFAWFTDTASTAVNTITSGTLDVEIVDKNGDPFNGSINFVKSADAPETETILWEPNATYETEEFKIVNKGNLALEFKLEISGILGDAELLDVIDLWLENEAGEKIDLGTEVALAPYEKSMEIWGNTVSWQSGNYKLVGHMDPEAGNEYQNKTIEGLGITVYATQVDAEYDSKDNQYDADSEYPGVVQVDERTFKVLTAEGLSALNTVFAETSHGEGSPITVQLMNDINMSGYDWEPLNLWWVNFYGNGFTVSNIDATANDLGRSGFAGYLGGAHIYDLTLENVKAAGTQAAIFAAHAEGGSIENCYVKGVNTVSLDSSANEEKWHGVGAFVGLHSATSNDIDITVDADAVIAINESGIDTTNTVKINDYLGYAINGIDVDKILENNDSSSDETISTISIYVENDAELEKALDDINADNYYWNKDVIVFLAENTYSADYAINQYPEWNGVVGAGGSGNNMSALNGTENVTKISFIGEDDVVFNGTVTVNGFGNSNNGFVRSGDAKTSFENIIFDGGKEYSEDDVIVVKVLAAANEVIFEGCTFKNATHVTVGGSNPNIINRAIFNNCEFVNGNCISGVAKNLTVTNSVVTNAYKGFINNQNSSNVTVDNCTVDCSEYAFRTNNSNINISVTGSTINVAEEVGVADLVKFRGAGPHTATFTDCDLSYKAQSAGTGTVTLNNCNVKTLLSEGLLIDEDGNYYVSNATGMSTFANTSVTGTISLMNDIDFKNAEFKAIGAKYGYPLTIEGNGHTISNVTVSAGTHNGMNNYGLFYAYTNSTLTINDLIIENVTIETTENNHNSAILVAYADGGSNVKMTNVDVVNSHVDNEQGGGAAIYVAYTTGNVTLTDCDISDDCTVVSAETSKKTGAYVGTANTTGCTVTITNCNNNTDVVDIGRNINGTATIIIDGAETDEYYYEYK